MNRVINTKISVVSSALQSARHALGINPDVNSQGQIDEDGDYVGREPGEANSDVNDPSARGIEEDDDSPAVHSLTVQNNGTITDIVVRVSTPEGAVNKRHVVPGHLTAKRLAAAIANIKNW